MLTAPELWKMLLAARTVMFLFAPLEVTAPPNVTVPVLPVTKTSSDEEIAADVVTDCPSSVSAPVDEIAPAIVIVFADAAKADIDNLPVTFRALSIFRELFEPPSMNDAVLVPTSNVFVPVVLKVCAIPTVAAERAQKAIPPVPVKVELVIAIPSLVCEELLMFPVASPLMSPAPEPRLIFTLLKLTPRASV